MKTNTAEGGSDSTLVTTGNSGGASGDAFTSRVAVANSVIKFATAAALNGALGYEFLNSSGVAEANYVTWDDTALATYWGRQYLKLPAAPNDTVELRQFRTAAAGATACHISVNASRQIQIRTAAEASAGTLGTALTLGTIYRLEHLITCTGAASVDVTLNLYAGHSATLLDTLTATGVASSGAIASIGSVRIGAATTTVNTNSIYTDDIVEFSTTAPGPSVTTTTVFPAWPRLRYND